VAWKPDSCSAFKMPDAGRQHIEVLAKYLVPNKVLTAKLLKSGSFFD